MAAWNEETNFSNLNSAQGLSSNFISPVQTYHQERLTGPPPVQDPNPKLMESDYAFFKEIDTLLQGVTNLQEVHAKLMPEWEKAVGDLNEVEAEMQEFSKKFEMVEAAIAEMQKVAQLPGIMCETFHDAQNIQRAELTEAKVKQEQLAKEKVSAAKGRVDALKERIDTQREVLRNGVKEQFKEHPPQNPNFCSICVSESSNIAIVPCGHTFCEGCLEKNPSQFCPGCRTRVDQKMKLQNL